VLDLPGDGFLLVSDARLLGALASVDGSDHDARLIGRSIGWRRRFASNASHHSSASCSTTESGKGREGTTSDDAGMIDGSIGLRHPIRGDKHAILKRTADAATTALDLISAEFRLSKIPESRRYRSLAAAGEGVDLVERPPLAIPQELEHASELPRQSVLIELWIERRAVETRCGVEQRRGVRVPILSRRH
jgi:hypothetical protein